MDFQAEYQVEPVLIRAEYGTVFDDPIITYDTFYVEGAVKVFKGLQLAARYDYWQGSLADQEDPVSSQTLQAQGHRLGRQLLVQPQLRDEVELPHRRR